MRQVYFARQFPAYRPNSLLLDNALATMGAGLPSAIATKIVRPSHAVLAIVGDGGFMMASHVRLLVLANMPVLARKAAIVASHVRFLVLANMPALARKAGMQVPVMHAGLETLCGQPSLQALKHATPRNVATVVVCCMKGRPPCTAHKHKSIFYSVI